MHRQNEMTPERSDRVKLVHPKLFYFRNGPHRPIHLSKSHLKMRPVIKQPLNGKLDEVVGIVPIGLDIRHELARIEKAVFLKQSQTHGANVPGRGAISKDLSASSFKEGARLDKFGFFFSRRQLCRWCM